MQSLAFLWFEMQMAQQYLRDKTFGPAQSSDNSANLNRPIGASTLRRASVKQLPPIASAMEPRGSGSPSQELFRLIGSWFGKLAYNKGKNRREVVRFSR
jgi:hypothetical protein